MARMLVELLDDEQRRQSMGAVGRARVEKELAWHHQAARYAQVYDALLAGAGTQAVPA